MSVSIQWYDEKVPDNDYLDNNHKKFVGVDVKRVFKDFFTSEYRHLVAHFVLDDGRILNVSEFQSNADFNSVILLIELCVRVVIDNQVKYYEQKK